MKKYGGVWVGPCVRACDLKWELVVRFVVTGER